MVATPVYMKPGPYSLMVVYCIIALSLWMLNRDTLTNVWRDFLQGILQANTAADNLGRVGFQYAVSEPAGKRLTQGQTVTRPAVAIRVSASSARDNFLSRARTEPAATKESSLPEAAQRRAAAMALLIRAAAESPKAGGG